MLVNSALECILDIKIKHIGVKKINVNFWILSILNKIENKLMLSFVVFMRYQDFPKLRTLKKKTKKNV